MMGKSFNLMMALFVALVFCLAGCGGGGGGSTSKKVTAAEAGPAQNVVVGSLVTLDASQSTYADDGPITYQWSMVSKPAGSGAAISAPTEVKPTFVADLPGQYVVELMVTDSKSATAKDTTTVTASDQKLLNVPYVARNGLTVTLTSFSTCSKPPNRYEYTAKWSQENKTTAAITEGAMELYFPSAESIPQYGLFYKVNPGEKNSRSYTFDVPHTASPSMLEYDHENFVTRPDPVPGSLRWMLPIPKQ